MLRRLPREAKIGRYLLLEGGPTRWLAYDPELGRKLDLDVGIDPALRRRAQQLAKIVHRNIVRVHDVGLHDDRLYVAFEHMGGQTLRTWANAERPAWRATLEAFIQAAEGLAAAHRVGLIHGAISLDTLVRDDDGRVTVVEFLREGATPSPEDHHDDSLALAAALYEALWQQRPGDANAAPPADDRGTPRALRRVVLEAVERAIPPGVLALRLRRLRPRSRRWAWSLAASALVAAGFAATPAEPPQDIATSTYCAAFDDRLHAVWNPQVRGDVGDAIAKLGAAFAAKTWERAAAAVDDRVVALADAQRRDCARREAGERVNEAVSLCLHRRFESVRAFVTALKEPNTTMLAGLDDTVAALGTAAKCEAIGEESPAVPAVELGRVLELESALSEARMLRRMGKPAAALARAKTALRVAESLDARFYVAEAEYLTAEAQWDMDNGEAVAAYHRAFAAALASEHDDLVSRSAVSLAGLLAETGDIDEARRWVDHAAAAQERTGNPRMMTMVEVTRGEIDFFAGDYEAAKRTLESAQTRMTDDTEPSVILRTQQLHAASIQELGDWGAAATALEGTVQTAEDAFGPEHPLLVAPLISFAEALHYLGRLSDAATAIERAVELSDAAFGPGHYGSLAARMEWMSILDASGDSDRALGIAEEVLENARQSLGEKDVRFPGVLDAVARVYFTAGRQVEAVGLFRDAVRLDEVASGPNHPTTLILLGNLAASELGTNRFKDAERTCRTALERFETTFGPRHPRLIGAHLRLSAALSGQERYGEALPHAERAYALAEEYQVRGQQLGSVAFELAQAILASGGARARAITLGQAALRSLNAAQAEGWEVAQELDAVREWLNDAESR